MEVEHLEHEISPRLPPRFRRLNEAMCALIAGPSLGSCCVSERGGTVVRLAVFFFFQRSLLLSSTCCWWVVNRFQPDWLGPSPYSKRHSRRGGNPPPLPPSASSTRADYSLVTFTPLDVTDEDSINVVLNTVDHAIQWGEDNEPNDATYDALDPGFLEANA